MGAVISTPLQVLTRTLKAERRKRGANWEFWCRACDVARLGGLRGLYFWLDARERLGLDDPKDLERLFRQVERAIHYLEKQREEEAAAQNTWEERMQLLQQRAAAKNDWKAQTYGHIPKPRVASARQQRLHRKLDHLLAEVRAA